MRLTVRVGALVVIKMACVVAVIAQDARVTTQNAAVSDTRIPRNAKVYIAPMNGFETYLAAAFRKKEVPLIIVIDREQADFEITGTHEKNNASWAKTIFVSPSPSASASMQIVNIRTKVVVYADSSHRTNASRGERSTAEKLAKYLKKKIEDDEKASR